eukprot:scaffold31812_cov58-Phaeocystis_antarctica.AAC.2
MASAVGGHGGGDGGDGGGVANAHVKSRQFSMQLYGMTVVVRYASGIHATPSAIATARSGQFPGAYRACRSATE